MLRGRRAERREERREGRGDGDERVHYQMRQRLVSIGDDYWIETDDRPARLQGRRQGAAAAQDADLRGPDGHKLAKIQERVARIKDTMEIEDDDGHRVAMVKKALITPLRDRWTVKIGDGPDLEIQGNVLDHEYTIHRRPHAGGHGVEEVVPGRGHLWRGDRPGPGRGARAGRHGRGRHDGPPGPVTR